MVRSSVSIAPSAAVILIIGLLHLLYTYRGQKLTPRDSELAAKMTTVPLVISPQTTMWRAWVGLNASHGMGLVFFGVLYGYLALRHSTFLLRSWFLLVLGLVLLLGYAALAKLYWFPAPFRLILLATAFYLLGIVLEVASSV
jgi:hypothetical protein